MVSSSVEKILKSLHTGVDLKSSIIPDPNTVDTHELAKPNSTAHNPNEAIDREEAMKQLMECLIKKGDPTKTPHSF